MTAQNATYTFQTMLDIFRILAARTTTDQHGGPAESNSNMPTKLKDLLQFASDNRRLIVIPTIVCTLLAIFYAVLRPNRWEASQALFVRDESIGAITRGGRFESVDAMQTAQETMQEICRHPEVLRRALDEVGVDSRWRKQPNARDIDELRKKVQVTAPNGAQFGRTEMVYLTVEARTVERAMKLTNSVTRHLTDRMKQLRLERYNGIVGELEESLAIGRAKLDDATQRLESMEKLVGKDIAELRVLMDQGQGEGNVRRALAEIESEIRRVESELNQKSDQYAELTAALDDPRKLASMSNAVLDKQPALLKLKEGLVAAQLKTSTILGVKNAMHPDAQAAVKSEQRIREQLHRELQSAVGNLKSNIGTTQEQVASLKQHRDSAAQRMGGLAAMRTKYSNLSAEVQQRVKFVEQAERNLAVARSNRVSAESVSLIQRIEQPVAGIQPLGISKKVIVLGGSLGGVAVGLGLLLLVYPVDGPEISGSSCHSGKERRGQSWGRRATDRAWQLISQSLPHATHQDAGDRRRSGTGHSGTRQTSRSPAKSPHPDSADTVVVQIHGKKPIVFGQDGFGGSSEHN